MASRVNERYRHRNRSRRQRSASMVRRVTSDVTSGERTVAVESQGNSRYSTQDLSRIRRILLRDAALAGSSLLSTYVTNEQRRLINDYLGQTYFTVT